jgi:hypothetical protein
VAFLQDKIAMDKIAIAIMLFNTFIKSVMV